MSTPDLYSAGSFSAILKGEKTFKPIDISNEFETDTSPMNVKVKMQFNPDIIVNYEFGNPLKITAHIFGDWIAELDTDIFTRGNTDIEKEFEIDALSFERRIRHKGKKKKIPFIHDADSNPKCITRLFKPPFPSTVGLAYCNLMFFLAEYSIA